MIRNFASPLDLKVGAIVDIAASGNLILAPSDGIGVVTQGFNQGFYPVELDLFVANYKGAIAVGDGMEVKDGFLIKSSSPTYRCISFDSTTAECAKLLSYPAGGGGGYTLPVASDTTLGGIKVGDNLVINGSDFLSVPKAGITGSLGVIGVDGTSIIVDENGIASSPGSGGVQLDIVQGNWEEIPNSFYEIRNTFCTVSRIKTEAFEKISLSLSFSFNINSATTALVSVAKIKLPYYINVDTLIVKSRTLIGNSVGGSPGISNLITATFPITSNSSETNITLNIIQTNGTSSGQFIVLSGTLEYDVINATTKKVK